MNLNQDKSRHGGTRPGAGRPRGSKGRRTEDIEAMLERLGCNPLEVLAMIAINDKEGLGEEKDIAIALRQRAASDLAPYIAPRLRSTQMEFGRAENQHTAVVMLQPELVAKIDKAAGIIENTGASGESESS